MKKEEINNLSRKDRVRYIMGIWDMWCINMGCENETAESRQGFERLINYYEDGLETMSELTI